MITIGTGPTLPSMTDKQYKLLTFAGLIAGAIALAVLLMMALGY